MRKGLLAVGVLVLSVQLAGCRERTGPAASLKGDEGDDNAQIVALLDSSCAEAGCHESENNQLPRSQLIQMADQTKRVTDCLNNPDNSDASKKVTCFRSGGAAFSRALGIYRATVKHESLLSIVKDSGATEVQQKQFAKLIMPPGSDQNVFESIESWQRIRDWLAAQPPNYNGINAARPAAEAEGKDCKEFISPELTAHVVSLQGPKAATWTKIHRDNKLPMFGCPEKNDFPKDPLACLTAFPDRAEWAAKNPMAGVTAFKLRELRKMPGFTSFWTRTSPDGRFVGNGGAPDETRSEGGRATRRTGRRGTDTGTNTGTATDDTSDLSLGAAIDDLAVKNRRILVTASYDPAFSPDNTKYMFVGQICPMQPLRSTKTKTVNTDDEKGSGCFTDDDVTTYQSIGQEAGAGDRFTIIVPGNYEVDNSGGSPTGAADPLFVPTNDMTIHSYTKDASGAFKATVVNAKTPNESQPSISVTSALLTQRFSPKRVNDNDFDNDGGGVFGPAVQPQPLVQPQPAVDPFAGGGGGDAVQPGEGSVLPDSALAGGGGLNLAGDDEFAGVIRKTGYRLRFVDKLRTDAASYDAAGDTTASEICLKGNKAMMSFDDRFIVTHHAIDQEDDATNAGKHADIWLYDILKKQSVRVTQTPPGTFALYPHFRADGWIYFLVREWDAAGQVRSDYILASDAALQMAKAP